MKENFSKDQYRGNEARVHDLPLSIRGTEMAVGLLIARYATDVPTALAGAIIFLHGTVGDDTINDFIPKWKGF